MNVNLMRALVVTCSTILIPNIASAFYAAHMGRWTSRDSFGEDTRMGMESPPDAGLRLGFISRDRFDSTPGYQDGMNLYQYARSTPTNALDPSGQLVPTPPPTATLVCTPVGAAVTACVVCPIIGYKVGECTTGPLTKWICDWYYKPCPPCPPPSVVDRRIDRVPPSKKHYPCTGDHEHVYIKTYNQDKNCKCWPKVIEVVNCL